MRLLTFENILHLLLLSAIAFQYVDALLYYKIKILFHFLRFSNNYSVDRTGDTSVSETERYQWRNTLGYVLLLVEAYLVNPCKRTYYTDCKPFLSLINMKPSSNQHCPLLGIRHICQRFPQAVISSSIELYTDDTLLYFASEINVREVKTLS